jgi:phosphatidylinositol-3-phosphatase
VRSGEARAAVLGLAVLGCGASTGPVGSVPALDHVIVVVLENHTYDRVRVLPYIAGLIADGATLTRSYAVTHPSQPNYLALWSGSTQGVTDDDCPPSGSPFGAENLGHACEAAGVAWRSYSENLPEVGSSICETGEDPPLYLRRHNPWTHFSNLDHSHERPYPDLALDIASGSLPALAFVIPNNCDSAHNDGCHAENSDTWLSDNVPAMLDALGNSGALIVTWDEDNSDAANENHILTVFVGPSVKAGYESNRTVNHYGVLRTICDALGLAPMGAAAQSDPITDIWSALDGGL